MSFRTPHIRCETRILAQEEYERKKKCGGEMLWKEGELGNANTNHIESIFNTYSIFHAFSSLLHRKKHQK